MATLTGMGLLSGLLGNSTATSATAAAEELADVLIPDEEVAAAYKLVRDQIIFTNRRIIWIDKQGVTGSKREIVSIPYRSVDGFSMENPGMLDLDAELTLWVKGRPGPLKWRFAKGTSIAEAHRVVSFYVLS